VEDQLPHSAQHGASRPEARQPPQSAGMSSILPAHELFIYLFIYQFMYYYVSFRISDRPPVEILRNVGYESFVLILSIALIC
jgi:hypothetical protein